MFEYVSFLFSNCHELSDYSWQENTTFGFMDTQEFPEWTCPHCLEKNPPFGDARCHSCGLHMLSIQEQQWRITRGKAAAETLIEWNQLPANEKNPAKIKPWLADLAPLGSLQEDWQEWVAPFQNQWDAWLHRSTAFQQQWRIHLWIMAGLLSIPMISTLITKDWMLAGLLSLPVAGWAWIGLFEYRKRNKP